MAFYINFGKKARVYYTLSISRGGGQAHGPPGFTTGYSCSILIIEYFPIRWLLCRIHVIFGGGGGLLVCCVLEVYFVTWNIKMTPILDTFHFEIAVKLSIF